MVLPLVKLGTLALKTLSKPIASRLKQHAGLHPQFRQFIVSMAQANHRMTTTMQRRIYGHATDVEIRPLNEEKSCSSCSRPYRGIIRLYDCSRRYHPWLQVAGVAVIFEVQRSSRSEARKEEIRKQELEELRQRDENLAREVELLKHKLGEIEQLAKGRGLGGIFKLKPAQTEIEKSTAV
ncbi:hypothetical protein CK203_084210 [Vitis vinifera]|uniref:OPA3-like protein n=1 Tax=Vitis vinifera TaxID=29760 RepID=A0A438DR79_VITVI|nr:hypothetical protein CK203_084210 [Vitis vinifera]